MNYFKVVLLLFFLLFSFESVSSLNVSNNFNRIFSTENEVNHELEGEVDWDAVNVAEFYSRLPLKNIAEIEPYAICVDEVCEVSRISVSGVTTYYQNGGQPWSNTYLNGCSSPKTIGNYGCAVTSYAMIASKYGFKDNPGQVNTKMGNGACNFDHALAKTLYKLSDSQIQQGTSISSNFSVIKGSLQQSKPIMITLLKPNTTDQYHFVVAIGIIFFDDGSYLIEIKDPTYNKYKFLESYMSDGYTILKMRTYVKI